MFLSSADFFHNQLFSKKKLQKYHQNAKQFIDLNTIPVSQPVSCKRYKLACAPIKDSDGCSMGSKGSKISSGGT